VYRLPANKQTNTLTDADENITSWAEVIMCIVLHVHIYSVFTFTFALQLSINIYCFVNGDILIIFICQMV